MKTWKEIPWGPIIFILGTTSIPILLDEPACIILFMAISSTFMSILYVTINYVERTTNNETDQLLISQRKIENLKDKLDQAEALLAATKEVNIISKKYDSREIKIDKLELNIQRIKSDIKKLEALVAHSSKPQEPEMVIVSMLPAYRVEKQTDYHDLT